MLSASLNKTFPSLLSGVVIWFNVSHYKKDMFYLSGITYHCSVLDVMSFSWGGAFYCYLVFIEVVGELTVIQFNFS